MLRFRLQSYKKTGFFATPILMAVTRTFFSNLNLATECGFTEHRWDKYCELREQAIFIERMLGEEYFSHDLINMSNITR